MLLPGVGADDALAAGHGVHDLLHDRYSLADGLEVPLGATVGVADPGGGAGGRRGAR